MTFLSETTQLAEQFLYFLLSRLSLGKVFRASSAFAEEGFVNYFSYLVMAKNLNFSRKFARSESETFFVLFGMHGTDDRVGFGKGV